MSAIWKFDVAIGGIDQIVMPLGALIVHVGTQSGDDVKLWAECDPSSGYQHRRAFCVVGTGHPLPDGKYIGTAVCMGGALVWHVYEVDPA